MIPRKGSALILSALMALSVILSNAHAQVPPPLDNSVQISTDKSSYKVGENVLIKVQVRLDKEAKKVSIAVIGPDGETHFKDSSQPGSTGVVAFKVEISEHYSPGEWIIVANYGDADGRTSFRIIGNEGDSSSSENGGEGDSSESEGERDRAQERDSTHVNGLVLDKDIYAQGDTVFLKGTLPSKSAVTIVVLDPDEDVYLDKDLQPGSDGSISFSFELGGDAKTGTWSVQVIAGDEIEGLDFTVVGVTSQQQLGTAVMKDLKKMTLMAIRNTGDHNISSLLIKVNQGSIVFLKAKNWDRSKVDNTAVLLKSENALQPNQLLVIILKWNDRAQIAQTTVPVMSMQGPVEKVEASTPIAVFGSTDPMESEPEPAETKEKEVDMKDSAATTDKAQTAEVKEFAPGQEYEGLKVNSVEQDQNKVSVDVTNCWGPACSLGPVKNKVLEVGESITFKCDSDALLTKIDNSMAVFEIKKVHAWLCMVV